MDDQVLVMEEATEKVLVEGLNVTVFVERTVEVAAEEISMLVCVVCIM